MQRTDAWLNTALVTLGFCATVLTALAARKSFKSESGRDASDVQTRLVANWKSIASEGYSSGPRDAPVTLVIFSDYQCPYCATAESSIRRLQKEFPRKLRVVRRHWPLVQIHPFSEDAANAVECAKDHQLFEQFTAVVYAAQASFGSVNWSELAVRSGLQDTTKFSKCAQSGAHLDAIRKDAALARSLGTMGTPTILLDSLLYVIPPEISRLEREVRERLLEK